MGEIISKCSEIVNKKGYFELQNIFEYERKMSYLLKENIKFSILKEVVLMFQSKSLPFVQNIPKINENLKMIVENSITLQNDKNNQNNEIFETQVKN